MRTEFTLYLNPDQSDKLGLLNKLEVAFDDVRNELPESYFDLVQDVPFGSTIKITMEVIE